MPVIETYVAEVQVSVVLRSERVGEVARYTTTGRARHSSFATVRDTVGGTGVTPVVEQALADAVLVHQDLVAGVQNAEARRLK